MGLLIYYVHQQKRCLTVSEYHILNQIRNGAHDLRSVVFYAYFVYLVRI